MPLKRGESVIRLSASCCAELRLKQLVLNHSPTFWLLSAPLMGIGGKRAGDDGVAEADGQTALKRVDGRELPSAHETGQNGRRWGFNFRPVPTGSS
jgi:hypothetical protein